MKGYHFGGPHDKDYGVWGLYRGPAMLGNYHFFYKGSKA